MTSVSFGLVVVEVTDLTTRASLLKPNLLIGSRLSNGGKSVSTSPSSSAIFSVYDSMFVMLVKNTKH